MIGDLDTLTAGFARAIEAVDLRRPQAVSSRTGAAYQPGIGPHPESQAVTLITAAMATQPIWSRYQLGVPYGTGSRQRCDWCLGDPPAWNWAVEVKMLRMMGDNNKPNDNMLMHILSPYPAHRSALTDCVKLAESSLGSRRAVLIYAFEYSAWPSLPAIEAFEALAAERVDLGPRCQENFEGLVHPVHTQGSVFAWEVGSAR